MSLITCPECGREISDTVNSCPHCGFSIKKQPEKKNNKTVILFIVLLVLAVVLTGFILWYILFAKSWVSIDISRVDASVVKVSCFDQNGDFIASGSGFVYNDPNTIVTNYHVIDGAYSITIETSKGDEYPAGNVMNFSVGDDIALIHISSDMGLKPLKAGDVSSIEKGDPVIAIGCPVGLKNVVSDGIISGTPKDDYFGSLMFTAPISHGSSGGALLNKKGEVIGVTYASDESGQALNFAIPIDKVNILINSKPVDMSLKEVVELMNPEAIENAGSVDIKQGYASYTIPYDWYLYNKVPESHEIPFENDVAEQNYKMGDYWVYTADYIFFDNEVSPKENIMAYLNHFGRDAESYYISDTEIGDGVIAVKEYEETVEGNNYTFIEMLLGSNNSCFLIGVRYQTRYKDADIEDQIYKIADSVRFSN